jgi:phasin family protein
MEELIKLNMEATNAIITESIATAKEFLCAKNPQEFFVSGTSHVKRDIQNTTFYGCEAMRIISSTQAEFNKAMVEKIAEANRNGSDFLIGMTKNVPMSAEHVLELLKSAWGTAGSEDMSAWKASGGQATDTDSPSVTAAKQSSRGKHNNQSASAKH